MFELTFSVNVPAERAKLRALRNDIAADVKRKQLPHLHPLEAAGKQGDGETPLCPLRVGTPMGIPATFADMREASGSCAGCSRCSTGLGGQGVSA